jgi:hypothetical protein
MLTGATSRDRRHLSAAAFVIPLVASPSRADHSARTFAGLARGAVPWAEARGAPPNDSIAIGVPNAARRPRRRRVAQECRDATAILLGCPKRGPVMWPRRARAGAQPARCKNPV